MSYQEETNNKTPMIAAAVALLLIGGGAYFLISSGQNQDFGTSMPTTPIAPVESPNATTPTDTTSLNSSSGSINPDIPLASVPSKNPFSPLVVVPEEAPRGGGSSGGILSSADSSSSYDNDSYNDSFSAPSVPLTIPSVSNNSDSFTSNSNSSSSSSSNWDSGSTSIISLGDVSTGGFKPGGLEPEILPDAPKASFPKSFGFSTNLPSSIGLLTEKPTPSFVPEYAQENGEEGFETKASSTEIAFQASGYVLTGTVLGPENTAIFRDRTGKFHVVEQYGPKSKEDEGILPNTKIQVFNIGKGVVELAIPGNEKKCTLVIGNKMCNKIGEGE